MSAAEGHLKLLRGHLYGPMAQWKPKSTPGQYARVHSVVILSSEMCWSSLTQLFSQLGHKLSVPCICQKCAKYRKVASTHYSSQFPMKQCGLLSGTFWDYHYYPLYPLMMAVRQWTWKSQMIRSRPDCSDKGRTSWKRWRHQAAQTSDLAEQSERESRAW